MSIGILKIADDGEFLQGSIEEQVTQFDIGFPSNESCISEITLSIDSDYNFGAPGVGYG